MARASRKGPFNYFQREFFVPAVARNMRWLALQYKRLTEFFQLPLCPAKPTFAPNAVKVWREPTADHRFAVSEH